VRKKNRKRNTGEVFDKKAINIVLRRASTLKSVSSLCRGHANLLCIVPIFSYVTRRDTVLVVTLNTFLPRYVGGGSGLQPLPLTVVSNYFDDHNSFLHHLIGYSFTKIYKHTAGKFIINRYPTFEGIASHFFILPLLKKLKSPSMAFASSYAQIPARLGEQ
jgi:hypothetical protein